MDDRTNIIAMMVLGAGIVALGGTVISGEYFRAERPEKMGYIVEGVEEEGGEGAAAEVPIAVRMQTADVAKGEAVFKKCASCHSINQGGANGIGPNLWGTLGAKHGHTPGFAYSDVLKSKPGPWTFEQMDAWLLNPRGYANGTKMSFAGLSKGEDRANVIAYMNAQGSNLPLPAAPPAGSEAGAPADSAERPGGQQGAENTPTPPGGPQPGGTSKGTAEPAKAPNT